MSAAAKWRPAKGEIVVLRHLGVDARCLSGTPRPPTVGIIDEVRAGGEYRVRLHMGGFKFGHISSRSGRRKWSPNARTVKRDNIDRLATAREAAHGLLDAAVAAPARSLTREEIDAQYPIARAS
jgi:hypothetical protein